MKSLRDGCELLHRWLAIWTQVLMGELIATTKPTTDLRR